jgi:hypothetical protein
VETTDDTQQLHVQRTQNAGQPLSGAESFAPIAQLSGTSSELSPLASDIKTVSTAMNSARRIRVDRTLRAPGCQPRAPTRYPGDFGLI